jgi:hypothetical protein
MDPSQFGPFANIVALAGALVAVFGTLVAQMLGRINRWAWLTSDSPSFLVAAGARVLTVALMAATYVTISPSNYHWFALAAVVIGGLGFVSVARFDRLRRLHVVPISLVAPDGKPLLDARGKPVFSNVVVGSEAQLRPEAVAALAEQRKLRGGVSLLQFMSGYGSQRVNDPEAMWDRGLLADIANKLTTALMYIVLLAVMTVFLAAFVIEVASRGEG